jgi:hypothetical protein
MRPPVLWRGGGIPSRESREPLRTRPGSSHGRFRSSLQTSPSSAGSSAFTDLLADAVGELLKVGLCSPLAGDLDARLVGIIGIASRDQEQPAHELLERVGLRRASGLGAGCKAPPRPCRSGRSFRRFRGSGEGKAGLPHHHRLARALGRDFPRFGVPRFVGNDRQPGLGAMAANVLNEVVD